MFSQIVLSGGLLAMSALAAGGKDYNYKLNGQDWGPTINAKYDDCVSGKEQSPIDLSADGAEVNASMEIIGYNYFDFAVSTAGYKSDNPAHTVALPGTDKEGNEAKAELNITFHDGQKKYFTPAQFHFHAPSEHSVDGSLYDAEVHLVHIYKGTEDAPRFGAVIGIFFDMEKGGSEPNAFLDSLWSSIDTINYTGPGKTTVNLNEFLSTVNMKEYWSYDGSFTTPPCTEGIKWTVIKQVQSISAEQLKKFTENLADKKDFAEGKGNNREVMPLNERTLYYTGDFEADSAVSGLFTAGFTAMTAIAALSF